MISLLHKTWRVSEPSLDLVNPLVKELKISPLVAGLLVNRKVNTADDARYYLDADLTKLHDPFLMTGMRKAVDRVVQSIEAKEKELIIKALRKNNNKRKYAARDLGISERTLYRKIKLFEIDD